MPRVVKVEVLDPEGLARISELHANASSVDREDPVVQAW
jgi:hypothetical protein